MNPVQGIHPDNNLKTSSPPLSPKLPLLHRPQTNIRYRRKSEGQRKPNVASKRRLPNMSPNRPHKPHLRHAHDSPEDTEAKSDGGCDARGEAMRGGVVGDVVAMDAAFEEEVFGESDAFVDGEPVALGHVRRLEKKGRGWGQHLR